VAKGRDVFEFSVVIESGLDGVNFSCGIFSEGGARRGTHCGVVWGSVFFVV